MNLIKIWYNVGNVDSKAHLTFCLLHLHMCHSLDLCFSHPSKMKLLVRQSGDVCVKRAPVHLLWASSVDTVLTSFTGAWKRYVPKQVFMERIQWLQ